MGEETKNFCFRCGHRLRHSRVEGRSRLTCPECGWVKYENPLPAAVAVVRNRAGELLLVKRATRPGVGRWALPSGFVEIEEPPERACLRELKEETGLRGKIRKFLGVYTQRSLTYRRVLIVAYEVNAEGEVRPGSDTKDARFFGVDDLPAIAFSSHKRIIEDILRHDRHAPGRR